MKESAFTIDNWRAASRWLLSGNFIGADQHATMMRSAGGEEGEHFRGLFVEFANRIREMPSTHQTDGQGCSAVAYLHYFAGGRANVYITEKDKGNPGESPDERQWQAFGLVDLYGDGGEIGYVCLPEIFRAKAELDLYWKPKMLAEIQAEREAAEETARTDRERARMQRESAA